MGAQPAPGWTGICAQQCGNQCVKLRTMIHMDAMGHLVRDRRTAHEVRRKDQSPAEAQITRRRATAPARNRIANANAAESDAKAFRQFTALGVKQRLGFRLQPAQDSWRERIMRPASLKDGSCPPWLARQICRPGQRQGFSCKRDTHARMDRLGIRQGGQLRFDPAAFGFRPTLCVAKAGAAWNGQAHASVGRADDKPHLARPGGADHDQRPDMTSA